MKLPIVLSIVALAAGCKTDSTGATVPDWDVVALELELGAADARDAAALFESEAIQENLASLATVLEGISAALEGGAEPSSMTLLVEGALGLADELVAQLPEDEQPDARAALVLMRSLLRRIAAYAK